MKSQQWLELLKESYEEYKALNNERAKELATQVFDDILNTYRSKGLFYSVWLDLTLKIEPNRKKRLAWLEVC